MGRPPASGQAGFPKVPMKEPPSTPFKKGVKSQPDADINMSPPVPKASAKPPSPAKDVHMSGSTPIPAKGTPMKPGYTPLSTSSIRRPDSLTTVARSTSTLVLGDFPEAHEDPSTSVRRLIFEGYYGMPCQDKQWPSLEEVIRVKDAAAMMSWMQDALPRHPKQGVVLMDDCRSDLLLDPKGLPWNLQLINAAWNEVGLFELLKDKSKTMTEAVHNQSEHMIHKLRQQLDSGDLTEDQLHRRATATEQWRAKKIAEIQSHLDRKEMAALVAIDKAVVCFEGLWGLFRDFGHLGDIPVEDDEVLFMNELEESMANFSLEAWEPSTLPLPETLVEEQETAQQGVESEPGVPNEAEAMEGTEQEAEQQGLDSKPGVPDKSEATQGTGSQEAKQQGVDSKPGVLDEAEATQRSDPGVQSQTQAVEGTSQEAEQQGLDSKPGVPNKAEATQGTGNQQDPAGLQLATGPSKTQQRTDAVFAALEKPNCFDLKEATLTQKEGESQEQWMTRVAHNVFMKFHRTTMAHGLEIAMPSGSGAAASGSGDGAGIQRRPSSMALPMALGDQEAGSTLAPPGEAMDKKKKVALTNQSKNKIALASSKIDEAKVLQEEVAQNEEMSQPIRDGFLKDLQNHSQCLQQTKDKLSTEVEKGSGDRLQELLDVLNQKITNYVQSTNAMKKMSAAR
ncbi:Kcnh2 [Symbiodinium sp. CCMP2592]|nr:Kcnh2 [Symbiodinium sp. CCMP2592]